MDTDKRNVRWVTISFPGPSGHSEMGGKRLGRASRMSSLKPGKSLDKRFGLEVD